MNSFYGQMRWGEKFEQFFYEFKITNNEFSENNEFNIDPEEDKFLETIKSPREKFISPNEDFAIFNINTANHWIGLIPIDSLGDDKDKITQSGVTIFHKPPDFEHSELIPTLEFLEREELLEDEDWLGTSVSLMSGDYLKISNINYDKAGHATVEKVNKAFFKLPEQIISINDSNDLKLKESDQKFHFYTESNGLIQLNLKDTTDELTFSHKTFFSAENIPKDVALIEFLRHEEEKEGLPTWIPNTEQVFLPGDYITTYELTFDAAGHLTGKKEIFYQLPISEMDTRVSALETAVQDLNTNLGLLADRVGQNETDIEKLTKIVNRVGSDTEFDNLSDAILSATRKRPAEGFSLASGVTDVTKYVAEQMGLITSIASYVKYIESYLDGKFSDYIPVM